MTKLYRARFAAPDRLLMCIGDITNFFITYPDATQNRDYIESMKPVFVLPDNELQEAVSNHTFSRRS